jgi:SNF2 family DNA or RNA helicase
MVGPFILRRLKENVLKDLPDKMEEIRFSKFDAAQRKLYDAQVTHMKKLLESEDYKSGKDKLKVLAELTKIRQICCDPALITAGYTGESAKRTSCLELIESAIDGGHKILLFSQFTSMFELLERDLRERGIEFYKITGETRKEERIKLVHAFNDNEVPLFLISLKAGGTGLNLTGADVVIHYDPWWNLAAQNQATDRAHRIGQTRKVSVFKLIVKGTIEEKIVEMQNAKKDLADAILSGENESLMNMSKEQLMELLG